MARALAESAAEADRLALARAFGSRLISAWWDALTRAEHAPPALRPPMQPFEMAELPPSAEALADSLGETAAELDAEAAAYHIGLTYTCTLPRAHRASMGIYYTPPCLTARLIAQATAGLMRAGGEEAGASDG